MVGEGGGGIGGEAVCCSVVATVEVFGCFVPKGRVDEVRMRERVSQIQNCAGISGKLIGC